MRSVHIEEALAAAAGTTYDAGDSPFHAGNEIVAVIHSSRAGTAGGRGWTAEGNNEPEGDTPVWVALTAEVTDELTDIFTITMPRQIRLNNTTAGSGSKTCSMHLIGEA